MAVGWPVGCAGQCAVGWQPCCFAQGIRTHTGELHTVTEACRLKLSLANAIAREYGE